MTDETLLIVGASARAAAQSARRAGWKTAAVDLFADADLQATCPSWRVSDYPHGLVAAAASAPPGPWLYTGGLENHPDVVAAISSQRELLGNGPAVLRQCRDPFDFRQAFMVGALPFVNWRHPDETPTAGKWMLKPRGSSGGQGLQLFQHAPYPIAPETHYWEEFQEGLPQSAVYVANDDFFVLLGVTEQLIGAEWTGASGFQYAGSLGPLPTNRVVLDQYEQIGLILRAEYGLRGLFGVDTVLSPANELFPIELNPRYTASIEVLERALGLDSITAHVQACRANQLPTIGFEGAACEQSAGKAILYAREDLTITDAFAQWCSAKNAKCDWPALADLPVAGTEIRQGQPILTVFAAGQCVESARTALRKAAAEVFAKL